MPGIGKYLTLSPTGGSQVEVAGGQANGLAVLDPGAAVPLVNLQVRTAQVTRAARPVLVAAGGTFSAFLTSLGGPDATDGSWEAVYVEAFAPVGGLLSTALSTYLQALGLSSAAAATQIATIWATALTITP